ncbi:MAG: Abi family protein [Lentilactobacillus hilgardii]|uniref:Abi family protein n=3 Tax=Lentilactobacillus hilgardii TaxID=1588 RepID=UPI001CC217D7|nr:Abi family protein [Lentilactobacillus hilgardii]MBZ2200792.1 hypothetical protein [Lentilactobacillus hilgardii]MBZ2203791.1 hypothetical protein [Lentilactobacillus hilgardii]
MGNLKIDKPFKSYDEQLDILESRGLFVPDRAMAIHALNTYSYYDIVNGNLDQLLLRRHPDFFKSEVSFNDLIQIRFLEDELKALFLQQILNIEKFFKTKLSYYVAKNFGVDSNPGGYLDLSNYSSSNRSISHKTIRTLKEIRDHKNPKKPEGKPIAHYRSDHQFIPPWILIEELSLGETLYWFKSLKGQGKTEISQQILSIKNIESTDKSLDVFQQSIDIIRSFRNFFAHNSVLSHMRSKRLLNLSQIDFIDNSDQLINQSEIANSINRHNLFACFICILLLSTDTDQLSVFVSSLENIFKIPTHLEIIQPIFHLPSTSVHRAKQFVNYYRKDWD